MALIGFDDLHALGRIAAELLFGRLGGDCTPWKKKGGADTAGGARVG